MKQLDPKAKWLFFVRFLMRVAAFFIPLSFVTLISSLGIQDDKGNAIPGIFAWAWLLIPALVLLCYVWAWLTNYYYRYELAEAGFRKEFGVIHKRYVTIPYDRIQNVDIYRGILARILGLSDLNIQTAGSSAPTIMGEGRLPGLSKEEAERLRNELVERTRRPRSQGL